MNEQKARKLRRIEMAEQRFAGVLLAVGMPPAHGPHTLIALKENQIHDWYNTQYLDQVREFYIASITSAPRPNEKNNKEIRQVLYTLVETTHWLRQRTHEANKAGRYHE